MSGKYHAITRDLLTIISPLSYVTLDKFIRSGLYSIASHTAVCGERPRPDCAPSSLFAGVETGCRVRDTCSQTWKFFREARGSLSSSLISNQAHREPMNNPDDISPTLNRRTSGRIVCRYSPVLPLLFPRYFVIIFSAKLPLEFGLRFESTTSVTLKAPSLLRAYCIDYTWASKHRVYTYIWEFNM